MGAEKVEHYEIAGYGSARALALQLDEREVAQLLSHTLGEEESADHLLTGAAKLILQQARMQDLIETGTARQTTRSGSARHAS